MDFIKSAAKILEIIRDFFSGNTVNEKPQNGKNEIVDIFNAAKAEAWEQAIARLPVYETRRKEVEESSEPVEGIFYIYDGQIIPDYYSECLLSDSDNPLRREMYHSRFYSNYMRVKFNNLGYNEKSIPRGRVEKEYNELALNIDNCFYQNEDVIKQLLELYRLPENTKIYPHPMYRCPTCRESDQLY